MNKNVIAIGVLFLVAGVAVAMYSFSTQRSERAAVISGYASDYFDQSAAIDDRIRALEAAVAEERNARQLLEDELQVLYEEIERLSDVRSANDARDEEQVAAAEIRERIEVFRQRRSSQDGEDDAARLVAAGFTPDRAAWIVQRESELQMEAMQARFDARRSGDPMDPFDSSLNSNSALRAEIGDAEYEQYLQANNRPTAVSVGSILESSPAQRVGLQPGDQIVSYDGSRVFDASDLNQQTMLGEPGESVVVDITRDGIPMQVVMPRGPIGVSTGRNRGRR